MCDPSAQERTHRPELLIEVGVQLIVDPVPIDLRFDPSIKPSSDIDVIRMSLLSSICFEATLGRLAGQKRAKRCNRCKGQGSLIARWGR
jgi:hypothetical protein